MDDLISRQAAIDALDKRFDSIPMEQTTEILLLRKDLRNLPSAQPEQNAYVVTYQDGDEEPVLSVFNNEVAAIAYRDEEGKNHDRIWLDEVPIFSKTLVDGRWFG